MSARCKFAFVLVARFDGEAPVVDKAREGERDSQVGRNELRIMIPDEGPWSKIGAVKIRANGGTEKYSDRRAKCCIRSAAD